ncbi:MAG: RNA methyltransferase [Calditrichae bacterium]|nr:RNA methyltransferase [Calditrichia bacterium]
MIQENIYIILTEPESPGNVGSVARAMKTTGFANLRLVNPCATDVAETRMMAHRSMDIVHNAVHFSSLENALKDIHISIGTTMRKRQIKFPQFSPEELALKIKDLDDDTKVALVFGRERNGLHNEELNLCQFQSTIPIVTQNPALNLAQSVMIYTYIFMREMESSQNVNVYKPAGQEAIESVYTHLEQALRRVNFIPRDDMQTFITRFRRFLGRTIPEVRDLQMLHKIIQVLSGEDKNP